MFRRNRDVNSDAKRIAAFLVFLGLLHRDPAADDMVANAFELSGLVADEIFNSSVFLNIAEKSHSREPAYINLPQVCVHALCSAHRTALRERLKRSISQQCPQAAFGKQAIPGLA